MAGAIRQVDHVNVLSGDPARTAAVLADAPALPVSAPLLRCPTFELEILAAGNVTLESIRHGGGPRLAAGIALTGIVFEPDGTAAQCAELRARGVPHVAPLALVARIRALSSTSPTVAPPPSPTGACSPSTACSVSGGRSSRGALLRVRALDGRG